jgi:uncharacterized membrane protein YfcA
MKGRKMHRMEQNMRKGKGGGQGMGGGMGSGGGMGGGMGGGGGGMGGGGGGKGEGAGAGKGALGVKENGENYQPLGTASPMMKGAGGQSPQQNKQSEEMKMGSELKSMIEHDKSKCPFKKLIFVFIEAVLLVLLGFLQGSTTVESIADVVKCDSLYWTFLVIFLVLSAIVSTLSILYLRRMNQRKKMLGFKAQSGASVDGDKLTGKMIMKITIVALSAGIIAGIFGIGGGMIMNPILLELGFIPEVAANTNMYMVMFTSGASTFQYVLVGEIRYQYALVGGVLGMIGTVFAVKYIAKAVKATGKSSILVFILAGVMGASAIAIPVFGVWREYDTKDNVWEWDKLCPKT